MVTPSAPSAADAVAHVDALLRSRSVIFVTGKGGVGKSAVTALLALRAREIGLSPVVFECDAPARPSLFPEGKPVGRELGEIAPGILGVNQDSDDAVRAYAVASLPSKTLAELLFENRVSRLFLRASPSVTEMALVGRIVQLAEAHDGQGPVLVDLHATGHALALLKAPDGIMRVLRAGPVYERAKQVKDFLLDKNQCAVVTVALPEELPVTELLEFMDSLEETGVPLGPVFVNGAVRDLAATVDDDALQALAQKEGAAGVAAHDAQVLRRWSRRAQRETDRLREGLAARSSTPPPAIQLPYVFDVNRQANETLAGRLYDDFLETGEPTREESA